MRYENVKNPKASDFKRLSGVSIETFNLMVKIVKNNLLLKKKIGRPSKLSVKDQILMTLEYLRGSNRTVLSA